ncbi:PIG-L family deacetylase [Candidatus Bipolaricaulota bacterium]|nr:PIG-L family deacetylase [Candidatus Bipolaricaulota bacterium]
MLNDKVKKIAVIVAHPDDEALWAGGTILAHPDKGWNIFSLTRAGDDDRAPRFRQALSYYGASGAISDMDDGKKQEPLDPNEIKETVLELMGREEDFDLVITHAPKGEYTNHRRHEEVSSCMTELWLGKSIAVNQFWMFAYDDGGGKHHPRPQKNAELFPLPEQVWNRKKHLIEEIYGFKSSSWEGRINPRIEAFWKFENREDLRSWLKGRER